MFNKHKVDKLGFIYILKDIYTIVKKSLISSYLCHLLYTGLFPLHHIIKSGMSHLVQSGSDWSQFRTTYDISRLKREKTLTYLSMRMMSLISCVCG